MATQQSFYEQDEEYLAEPSIPGYSNAQYDEDDESNQQGYQEYLDANGLAGMNGNGGAGDEELMEREMMEREQQNRLALEMVPEEVKRFIGNFYEAIKQNDTPQISVLYESTFQKLSHAHYSVDAWPEAEVIGPLVGHDQVFLTLYRELYFRHVYARLEPNVDDRFNSYENICELFNLLLNSESPVPLDLPVQWLWDMLDEFVYQFQSFGQWKVNVKNKSADELGILGESPQTWSCYSVLNVLYSLVQKAQINEQLAAERSGASAEEIAEIAGDFGSRPLYRSLGYFALICLLRVHVLLGDPTLALQTIQNIQLAQSGALHTKITACQVAVYYHVGIAFMSIGRYSDAIKTFIQVLVYFNRFKQHHTRSYQYNSVAKTCERMYALLAICTSVAPGPSDEGIMSLVKERHADQLSSMQRGGEDTLQIVRELYLGACPKFISPISPPYEDPERLELWMTEPPSDPSARQVDLLLSEVAAHTGISATRSLLKLYTSVDASKLASFADVDEDSLLERMMNLKSASRTYGHKAGEGSLLDGERLVTNHFDFTIDRAMLHVAETTVDRRFAGFFIRNAEHAQRVFDQIRHAPLPITRPAAGAPGAQAGQQGKPARGAAPSRGGPAGAGKPAQRSSGNPWGAVKAAA